MLYETANSSDFVLPAEISAIRQKKVSLSMCFCKSISVCLKGKSISVCFFVDVSCG